MPSIVSAEIFYLEQMQKNGRIKNVVIPEGVAARRVRESIVIDRIFLICYNNGSPTKALGDDGIKGKIRRKGNAKDRSSWG